MTDEDVTMTQTSRVFELLSRAKTAIEAGERHHRDAAEHIAEAESQGATQRQIAVAVEKSLGWVNRLLRWRQDGYKGDTAFGPEARASRQRAAQRVHATERQKKPAPTMEQAQAAEARARAETAKAEAAKAKADAQKAKAEAAKAKADARTAKANEKSNAYSAFRGAYGSHNAQKEIDRPARERLVNILGMLGSDHVGERANAAEAAEKLRRKLGLTWDELIVPAAEAEARAA